MLTELLRKSGAMPVPSGRRRDKWLFCLCIALAASALTFWPHGMPQFRYERSALLAGEEWRMLSAHLVHMNGMHLLFNLAGLFLLCELLWLDLPVRHGAGLLLISAMGVSLMLWWLRPDLAWYAGMSGALHGLWAGCALAACLPPQAMPVARVAPNVPAAASFAQAVRLQWLRYPMPRRIGVSGLALLMLKLMSEAHFGPSARTAQAIGGPVIAVAHAYGAVCGTLYVIVWRGMQKLFGRR